MEGETVALQSLDIRLVEPPCLAPSPGSSSSPEGRRLEGVESCVEMSGVTEMFMQREMVGLGGESW